MCVCICMFDWIRLTLHVFLFYLWSAHVSTWIIWLLNGMKKTTIFFPQELPASTRAIFTEENNQMPNTMMSHEYLHKKYKNSKLDVNLQKIKILQEVWGRIGKKSTIGILECEYGGFFFFNLNFSIFQGEAQMCFEVNTSKHICTPPRK